MSGSAVLERTGTSSIAGASERAAREVIEVSAGAATLDIPAYLDHLDQLESQSVFLFREAEAAS